MNCCDYYEINEYPNRADGKVQREGKTDESVCSVEPGGFWPAQRCTISGCHASGYCIIYDKTTSCSQCSWELTPTVTAVINRRNVGGDEFAG